MSTKRPSRDSERRSNGRKNRRKTSPYPTLKILPQTSLDGLDRLAGAWGLGEWDVIIAGDGSGQGYDAACGWASVLIDRHHRSHGGRKHFHGAWNLGTLWLAELMPYFQAMCWYDQWRGQHAHPCDAGGLTRVAIVSDCEGVVAQGNRIVEGTRSASTVRANLGLWVAMDAFESRGYVFRYHWIQRATCALNAVCDDVAGRSRLAVSETSIRSRLAAEMLGEVGMPRDADGREISMYDCNPDDDRAHDRLVERPAKRRASGRKKRAG